MSERDTTGPERGRSAELGTAREAAQRARVLCVTCDGQIASSLEQLARDDGLSVVCVGELSDAVSAARQHDFSVVGIDVALMHEPAFELLQMELPRAARVALARDALLELPRHPVADAGVVRIGPSVARTDALECLGRAQLLWETRRASASSISLRPVHTAPEVASVLLVEDSSIDAETLILTMRRARVDNVDVEHAQRLDRALELVSQRDFALIMTDLLLPDARGLDSVAALRRAAPNTPIVVLSGLGDEAVAVQAVQEGAQEYVLKHELTPDKLRKALLYAVGRKAHEDRLSFFASHDSLTGMLNRAHFTSRVEHALTLAKRAGERVAVMFVDLDRFKHVNDTLGHDAGDVVLRHTAECIHASVRESDTVARLGGDEFAVLAERIVSTADAIAIADRMSKALLEFVEVQGQKVQVLGSIGIAFFPDDGATAEELLRNADLAMYRAKRRGQGRFVCAGEKTDADLQALQSYRAELCRSFRDGTLELAQYPVFERMPTGLTAARLSPVLRARNGEAFELGTMDKLVDSADVSAELGTHLVREAVQLSQSLGRTLFVRVSASQFQDGAFHEAVERALRAAGASGKGVSLLISHVAVVSSLQRVSAQIDKFDRLGVAVWLDEFGVRGTQVDVLRQLLRLRGIILDAAWCEQLYTSPLGAPFLANLVGLAHVLALRVLAPPCKVERSFLLEAGIDGIIMPPVLGP